MRARLRRPLALLALAAAAASAQDTIVLTNGRTIEADRAWFEGTQLLYEKGGAVFGIPRGLVRSVGPAPTPTRPAPSDDPDLARALAQAQAGRQAEAAAQLRAALRREPRNLPALQALAELLLALGDTAGAAEAAQKAVALDERRPRSHELLGDALAALGSPASAAAAYRAALRLRADPALQRKLDGIETPRGPAPAGPEFRLRYDGGVNEPLGVAVLRVLGEAFEDFATRLAFRPREPVTVILQTETDFRAGSPAWAEGVYDGTVRIPVKGVERATRPLEALLRHELAHSFVTARTGGNCPTWIQEGVAQWLEGGDPARSDAELAARARSGRLLALLALEAPFQNLPDRELPAAYASSLSGVAHVLRLHGERGLARLLAALGDGLPSEEALPVALRMSYGEFQSSWESHLRAGDGR